MKRIYVAGPYSNGDIEQNVRNAISAADELADHGFAPFVPHLCHFWDQQKHRPYESWIEIDLEWVKVCDALLRIPGKSSGADGEIDYAMRLGIPVYFSIQDLFEEMK